MNPSLPIPQKYTEYGTLQTKEDILNWLEVNDRNYIKNLPNYKIEDGAAYGFTNQKGFAVELKGSVDISNKDLTNIPVKFTFVDGDFNCSGNNLDNFINSPNEISGTFNCEKNGARSLVGVPTIVGAHFIANHNNLNNFVGGPTYVGRSVDCKGSKLESLEGFPKTFGANGDLVNLNQNEKLGDIQDIRWAKDLKQKLETLDKPSYVKIIKENVSNVITAMRDSFNNDLKTTNNKKL